MRAYHEHGGYYAMARVAKGTAGRVRLRLLHVADLTEAQALADRIAEVLGLLEAAGQPSDVRRDTAQRLAESDHATRDAIERFARTRLASREYVRPVREVLTVRQFGERWTSGQLAQQYRGMVRRQKRAAKVAGLLEKWVYPLLEDLPLAAVRLEDIEAVAERITTPRLSSKKAILSALRQLFTLAVYPAKQIVHNPVPKALLSIGDDRRAFGWLRPGEVARLLACPQIPLQRRLCWGVMAHEGLRPEDAAGLRWSWVDLALGVITLGDHKTVRHTGARCWALGPDVVRALGLLRDLDPVGGAPWLVVLDEMAARLRADLLLAGVDRRELHETTETRRRLRAHDLRATFVTLALGAGRSESWVMDRTGHLTPRMLMEYRRQARTAADLGLGWLPPLDEAIPELAAQASRGASTPGEQTCSQQAENAGKTGDDWIFARGSASYAEREEGQKAAENGGRGGEPARCEQAASRPRRPLRRLGVSARRQAASGLLTARLERLRRAA